MAVARRGSELRVELNADEERMRRQLHDLGQLLVGGARRNLVAARLQLRYIDVVHFVAMTVPLVDFGTVDGSGEGAGLHRAFLRAEAHGAAQIRFVGALLNAAG